MYLRDMSSVELLSRAGEVAIAKRIEAGRGVMLAGLCDSPLTFAAFAIWRDALHEGKIYLRDIVDLEATPAEPEAKTMPAPAIGADHVSIIGATGSGRLPRCRRLLVLTPPFEPADETLARRREATRRSMKTISTTRTARRIGSSVAAIEAEAKPKGNRNPR